MPKFTKEQQSAIEKEGTNIIVSAGAGSGKTAVLTERVLRKLKQKIDIDKLLVLTFTKAAAEEMKERIKNKIKDIKELTSQLDKIDSAYITTFDSYSLSIVKKYHYLLNITPNVKICEDALIKLKKKEFIDDIFNELYQKEDEYFLNLINDFCVKDDEIIKNNILSIYNKISMKYDKKEYLKNYLNNNFNNEKIEENILLYEKLLQDKIKNIKSLLQDISYYVENDYYIKLEQVLNKLLNSNNYDEINLSLPDKLPQLPRNSEEIVKNSKNKISELIKEIKELCIYENKNSIRESLLSTKEYTTSIVDILIKLDDKLETYKKENDLFEFIDISHLAIKVVSEYDEVREEIKNNFNEILVDEYQDTNDLQELFISYISNNNVYMVGDIKQSIYRFRNANPNNFKNKYDDYSQNKNGIKIDLNKNFRSRREVLDNINYIFDKVMDNYLGEAEYNKSHRMVFGNTSYEEEGKTNQSNNMEFLNYSYDKDSLYKKEEIEAFIIANDILNKINNKYQIFDKDKQVLRNITYSDFVILMDRSTDFDLYKKIFEYLNIPLTIYKDNEINSSIDMLVISNILKLITKIKNKEFDQEFKYSYTSVARSFLFNLDDEEIFEHITNNTYKESIIYKKILKIIDFISYNTPSNIIDYILKEFNYYNKLLTITDIANSIDRIDYIKTLAKNISQVGYTIYDLSNIIDEILKENLKLTTPVITNDNNSCKIMTIHKSKGLEYHICYFPGLYKKFNILDLNDLFLYDNTYGIITPYYKEGIGKTITKTLLKDKYLKDEISEKIRLFYVSLTRCKEKIIFISSFGEEKTINYKENKVVDDIERLKYRSFQNILDSIEEELLPYIKNINLEDLSLTKDYNLNKKNNYINKINIIDNKIIIKEVTTSFQKEENNNYSKKTNELLTEEKIKNMEYGTKMHYYLQLLNLKTKDVSYIKDNKIKSLLNDFLSLDIFKNIEEANIYKEYEFLYEENNIINHGIIDLLIEYKDKVIIIDYKLSNIEDEAYKKQLDGYKDYIKEKLKKDTIIYLYSINKNILKKL